MCCATAGAVHMMGGVAGLAGAWVAGPRRGRFDANGKPVTMPGHNAVLYMSGVLLLWFGFYGEPAQALADRRALNCPHCAISFSLVWLCCIVS